ncbi:hypothetical protein DUNSADRAFT_13327 [Dunaliella salina]|uniref:Encoded protein n=1 Tax=Dunaliella salina TaxID=3046 RepID=A0ABQ7G9M3_DUNSA|nr:hypothetical protein DUNSADRAFT_13327 [Dunaliella salina]|eukprot:KAF5831298.1 hypothetical protein DUNSADRAFT_13327 [Dunaliella salina]
MLTEFSVTNDWYVLVAPPVAFNGPRFATSYLLGDVSFAECFDFDATQPSKIHLVPRGQPKETPHEQASNNHLQQTATSPQSQAKQAGRREPVVLDGPPLITSSSINSYECDGGRLVVLDAICERDLGFWKDVSDPVIGYYGPGAKPEIMRFTIDVQHPRLLSTRILSHR